MVQRIRKVEKNEKIEWKRMGKIGTLNKLGISVQNSTVALRRIFPPRDYSNPSLGSFI